MTSEDDRRPTTDDRKTPRKDGRRALVALVALALTLPALFLEAAARLGDAAPTVAESLMRLLFLAAALSLSSFSRPRVAMATLSIGALAGAIYALTGVTWAAWLLTLALWVAALWLAERLTRGLPWPIAALVVCACGGLLGVTIVALEQLEGGFAEEEFFSALAAGVLAAGWALTYLGYKALGQSTAARSVVRRPSSVVGQPIRHRGWIILSVALLIAAGGWLTLGAYRASFFPEPPPFEGVSAEAPFLCEQLPAAGSTFTGQAVFARLMELVEAHPEERVPELGMLALGTGDQAWAARFRAGLLDEAAQQAFSGPANSVKYGQFEAAQRVYYYDRVRAAFPALFGAEDDAEVRAWFAAVNRRALTVEWVDWLYAAALGEWPRGPYVNQETGAGLLAILEATGLGDPALAEQGRAYLEAVDRGWPGRWRNNDDTYYYQSEWITNALYQSLLGGEPPASARRSFEWLLLQMPPDGSPVGYNFPYPISPDAALYLGAGLLDDPRYLWAAGLTASSPARVYPYSAAQPGADAALAMVGRAPTEGSCLLFGDTGTPVAPGPLGPDKLVFRESWEPDGAYMLLNLRFTGWHRYKASNTISLIVQGETLVEDQLTGRSFGWLPRGRSAFRDKRIPRENLSGLAVGRSGISAVRQTLSGLGGPWAQDPPPFARVERFAAGTPCDESVTALDGWHGWDQRRTIRFCPGEPTVIADEAVGPAGARAAIMWNLARPGRLDGSRVRLSEGAELVLLALDGAELRGERPVSDGFERIAVAGAGPRLRAVAVLLTGPWLGAEAVLTAERLRVTAPDGRVMELEPFD